MNTGDLINQALATGAKSVAEICVGNEAMKTKVSALLTFKKKKGLVALGVDGKWSLVEGAAQPTRKASERKPAKQKPAPRKEAPQSFFTAALTADMELVTIDSDTVGAMVRFTAEETEKIAALILANFSAG